MRSIRRTLLWRLLLGGLITVLLAGIAAYLTASREVSALLDYQLEQQARSLIDRDLLQSDTPPWEDPDLQIIVRSWNPNGSIRYSSHQDSVNDVPFTTPIGFSDFKNRAHNTSQSLRIYTLESEKQVIQVMQPTWVRHQLAVKNAAIILLPFLGLLVAFATLSITTVRKGLTPLETLTDQLRQRDSSALTPLDTGNLPHELSAPVHALNDLLNRLDQAFAAHKIFIADAAHELRTPLTAIRLQAQNLIQAKTERSRKAAADDLLGGIDRSSHLMQQLLILAHEDPDATHHALAPVDLDHIARDTLIEQAAQAGERQITLGLQSSGPIAILGQSHSLHTLLSCLLDNAIKYSLPGGEVKLSLEQTAEYALLTIIDKGIGIPPEQIGRVFDRFYRGKNHHTPGSGLGLAIAEQIAQTHQATILLETPEDGRGLRVVVRFISTKEAAATDADPNASAG